jgi:hypothetical protein
LKAHPLISGSLHVLRTEPGFTDTEVPGDDQKFGSNLSKRGAGKALFDTMRKKSLTLLCPRPLTMTTQHLRVAIKGFKHDPLSRLEDESITVRLFLCGVDLPKLMQPTPRS